MDDLDPEVSKKSFQKSVRVNRTGTRSTKTLSFYCLDEGEKKVSRMKKKRERKNQRNKRKDNIRKRF